MNRFIFSLAAAVMLAFSSLITPVSAQESQSSYPVVSFDTGNGTLNVHLICHGSLALEYKGYSIQVDPVLQLGNQTIDYSSFPKADLILVTHEHGDHLSKEAVELLSSEKTRLILNPKSREILGKGEAMENHECLDINDDISLASVPAYNTTEDRKQFHPEGNGNGYLLRFGEWSLYISGDTENIPEMSELYDIQLAFLSANQPYTMTVEQCIYAASIINPKVLIPYHLGNTDVQAIEKGLAGSGIKVMCFESLR